MTLMNYGRIWIPCIVFLFTAMCSWRIAGAQELELPISPTPVGSGARAAGMADAFVAIADDATAASWNPAGLVQLELPEVSFVWAYNGIRQDFKADDDFSGTPSQSADNTDLNYFSIAYPLPTMFGDRNSTISFGYQQKYDLSRTFLKREHREDEIPGNVWTRDSRQDFDQDGQLGAYSLAYALEVTHNLSLGVTANFWRDTLFDDNGWSQESEVNINSNLFTLNKNTFLLEEYSHFEGENFTLGLLWNFCPKWNFGIRYDTAFTGDVDYRRISSNTEDDVLLSSEDIREDRKISFPDTLAIGVAYRANDRLTLSFDLTQTDWDDMYVETASGVRISLVDGIDIDDKTTHTNFKTTTTARLGIEYLFLPKQPEEKMSWLFTARGGIFYDEEPAADREGNVVGAEASGGPDAFYGFTLGFGALAYQRVNLDIAYQYRYGNDVNSDFLRGQRGFSEDVEQHRILLSTVVYF